MRISEAGHEDVASVVATLVGAFRHDPVWSWAFPDPRRRGAQHAAIFTCLVASAVERGWVLGTEDFGAVAVWIPPGEPELRPHEAAELEEVLADIAPDRVEALTSMFAAFEAVHPHDTPHFYLSLLGTRPERRGEGLGMGLLAATLQRIDVSKAPCYLESTNPANLRRYEHVGFESRAATAVGSSGLAFTGMWRPPAT